MLTQLFVVAIPEPRCCLFQDIVLQTIIQEPLWYVVVNFVEPLLLPFVPARDSPPLLVCSEIGMDLLFEFFFFALLWRSPRQTALR